MALINGYTPNTKYSTPEDEPVTTDTDAENPTEAPPELTDKEPLPEPPAVDTAASPLKEVSLTPLLKVMEPPTDSAADPAATVIDPPSASLSLVVDATIRILPARLVALPPV